MAGLRVSESDTAIDHLHFDVNAQILLVVVVKFSGNFESSSSRLAQESRDNGKENYSHQEKK